MINLNLDSFANDLAIDTSGEGIRTLATILSDALEKCSEEQWLAICSTIRAHAIHKMLLEDPYTARAFNKPRGYAGDAVMIDFVYDQKVPEGTSQLGNVLFNQTTGHENGNSVRYRRDLLRDAIKETISKNPEARILAVACGHLRELETLEIGSAFIVALDQDGESLRVVQERFPRVVLEKLSIGAMLRGKLAHSNFDLVYAAGLFDYLEDGVARHLCTDLIGRLSENGRLLIGNYTPNNTGRGYMDAVMDWQLIYRTEAALQDLLPLQSSQVATFTDPWGNVVYADYKRS